MTTVALESTSKFDKSLVLLELIREQAADGSFNLSSAKECLIRGSF